MKQVIVERFGGPEVLSIVDAPIPAPGPGEILIRIHAAIVCYPDALFRSGRYPLSEGVLPYIPCSEATGIVESVGLGVDHIVLGQAVYLNVLMTSPTELMGYATEKVVVPADSVILISDSVDLSDAIGLGYYSIARGLLYRGSNVLPNKLLQIGAAGSFASAVVQLASLLGVEVIGTVSSEEKGAFAKASGAAHTINYLTENVVDRVLEITRGSGVDMIVDHVGGPDFDKLFDALAPYGEICVVNAERGASGKDLLEPFSTHSKRWPAVRYFAGHGFHEDVEALRTHAREILALMANGKLRPIIARRFRLDDIVDAHELVETRSPMGRVLIVADGY